MVEVKHERLLGALFTRCTPVTGFSDQLLIDTRPLLDRLLQEFWRVYGEQVTRLPQTAGDKRSLEETAIINQLAESVHDSQEFRELFSAEIDKWLAEHYPQ